MENVVKQNAVKALKFSSNYVFHRIRVWYRHCTLKRLTLNFTTFDLQVCFKKNINYNRRALLQYCGGKYHSISIEFSIALQLSCGF